MKHKLASALTAIAAAAALGAGTFPALPTTMAAVQTGTSVKSIGKNAEVTNAHGLKEKPHCVKIVDEVFGTKT